MIGNDVLEAANDGRVQQLADQKIARERESEAARAAGNPGVPDADVTNGTGI